MGTTHRGSDKAGLGVIAAHIARLGIKESGDKLLRTLKEGSGILEKQRTDFETFSKEFRLVCLYEAYPTAGNEVDITPPEIFRVPKVLSERETDCPGATSMPG